MSDITYLQPVRGEIVHSVMAEILQRGLRGHGVLSGHKVSEDDPVGMSVISDAGYIELAGDISAVPSGSCNIDASHETLSRIDILYRDASGLHIHKGDNAAIIDPKGNGNWHEYITPYPKADCPSGIILAFIFVEKGAEQILDDDIWMVAAPGIQIDHVNLANKGNNTHPQIDNHLGSTSNPHSTTASQVGADITTGTVHAATPKTTPADDDELGLLDSAATFVLKKLTWTNIKATLKTYFDSLYAPTGKGVTNGDSHDHNGGDGGQIDHVNLANKGTNTHSQIDTHLSSTSNPHSTTASQVGADVTTETIHSATSKDIPADDDELALIDSSATYDLKKLIWSSLKTILKTYFDTHYPLKSLLTARGDLYYRDASSIARLAGVEQGSILYEGANLDPAWLTHGNWGDVLCSSGHGQNPFWGWIGGWIPAAETWTYASSDDPVFTFTCPGDLTARYTPGVKIALVQSSTQKYFIVVACSYSSGTGLSTVTIYGGTDYDLADLAISSPYYAFVKTPATFPMSPAKWTVELNVAATRSVASPVGTRWYGTAANPWTQGNLTLDIPIGVWDVFFSACLQGYKDSGQYCEVVGAASSTDPADGAAPSDPELEAGIYATAPVAGILIFVSAVARRKTITLTSKTTFKLLGMSPLTGGNALTGIYYNVAYGPATLRAVCAYL